MKRPAPTGRPFDALPSAGYISAAWGNLDKGARRSFVRIAQDNEMGRFRQTLKRSRGPR